MPELSVNEKKPGIPGDWLDITGKEATRTYHYGDGKTYKIMSPALLLRRDTGTHRIIDASGEAHMIPAGYLAISFTVPSDAEAYFIA